MKSQIRYYIYISKTKVDMLYSQIPKKLLERLALKVKINLGVIGAIFGNKPSEKTLYSKLNVVVD